MQKRVTIPAKQMHCGIALVTVTVNWVCPECGGPRGEIVSAISWDGSRKLVCDGWTNPCGHVDKYHDVRNEAANNGLNQ